jgi:2'-5' RNA ligase
VARLRLGVALLLPSPAAEEVEGLRRALKDGSLGRIPPHLTLVPPVNVAQADLPQALSVLRAAAAAMGPHLRVTLGAPTSFLPLNPVLYLPVVAGTDAVHALRHRIWQPPLTRELTWPFVPHVTLADEAARDHIDAAVMALAGFGAQVVFRRVHLLVERHPGPRWVPLADVALGPPAVVARGGPLALELVRSQLVDPEGVALLDAEGALLAVPPSPARGPIVVTARREGEVVGLAAAWLGAEGCRSETYVGQRHRRQGIGRHLQAALQSAVAEEGWGEEAG